MAACGLRLERTLGPRVAEWIETNLVHGPGDVQGDPVVLDDEQVRFLLHVYALDDAGKRIVRRAVYSRPKGRAKTELAAMIACAEALGPVRFAGWDDDARPRGRPVRSPFVRLAATEEGQAGNTYEAVRIMLTEGPLAKAHGLDVGLTRTYLPGGGKILPVTAAAASKEGGKESFACFDETGLYVLPELHRMYETIRRNLAKRKQAEPWSLETSAMYAVGEESVAEHSHRYAQAVAEGRVVDPGFLFDHRQAPEVDLRDRDLLRAALADVYGEAASWMDLDRLIAEAQDGQTQESSFRRFFLNQPVARSTAWLAPAAWQACALADYQAPEGTQVVLAFDGSYRLDASALVACTVEERPYLWLVGLWERPEGAAEDWVVPREHVDATVRAAMDAYGDVCELAYDPPGWHAEAERWADTYGDAVVAFPTATRSRMAAACSRFYTATINQQLAHDGDPRLARHIGNAVLKETSEGGYITKDGKNSPRKIDAAVAAVVAHERAAWHAANPKTEPFVAVAFGY